MAPSKPRKPAASAPSLPSKPSETARDASNAVQQLFQAYMNSTPAQIKLIDAFMAAFVVMGVCLFLYGNIISNFPFETFLSGFASCVGQFVLLAGLRIQTDESNRELFNGRSKERSFADFMFGSLVLHFFVFNYLG